MSKGIHYSGTKSGILIYSGVRMGYPMIARVLGYIEQPRGLSFPGSRVPWINSTARLVL